MQIYCNVKRHLCIETPKGFCVSPIFGRKISQSGWFESFAILSHTCWRHRRFQQITDQAWFHLICFHETCKSKVSNDIIHVGKASCFCRSHFAGALWETLSVRSRKARGVFRGPWQPCGQPWCRSSFIQDRWGEEILYERHLKASRYLMNLVFGARKLRMVDGFGASEVVVESPTHNALIGIAEDCQVARCKKSALFQQELQEFSWRHLRWW